MSCIEAATWTGAIATFIAVIVALFKEDIVKFWRCPNLDVRVKLEAPDCHKIPLQVINQSAGELLRTINSYYLRLWVFNSGRVRADRVQVLNGVKSMVEMGSSLWLTLAQINEGQRQT